VPRETARRRRARVCGALHASRQIQACAWVAPGGQGAVQPACSPHGTAPARQPPRPLPAPRCPPPSVRDTAAHDAQPCPIPAARARLDRALLARANRAVRLRRQLRRHIRQAHGRVAQHRRQPPARLGHRQHRRLPRAAPAVRRAARRKRGQPRPPRRAFWRPARARCRPLPVSPTARAMPSARDFTATAPRRGRRVG
jgi:hypothetical protein